MANRVQVLSNPRKRKAKTTRKRKSNPRTPARRQTTARRTPARRAGARRAPARRANPARRRRRNPAPRGIVNENLMPSLKGAAGAIVLDGAYSMLPIPSEYQTGYTGAAVKAGAILGMGYLAKQAKIMKPMTVRELVNGSLTVQLHAIGQELVGGMVGGVTTSPNNGGDSGDDTTQGLGYTATSPRAGRANSLAGYSGMMETDPMAGYEMV